MDKKNDVRVSVCMVTYNQKDYIADAIESVLMQKTDFKFRLLVGDDASTDGTTEIVRKYAEKYPDIIKPVFHEKNVGPGNNSIGLYKEVDTEYVALCDGDDYWIDPLKLQKQVDFLDKNKDYTGVFTQVKVVTEGKTETDIIPIQYCVDMWKTKGFFSVRDFIDYYPIAPVSVMWRWQIKDFSSPLMDFQTHLGDIALAYIHAKEGKTGFIEEVTSVYRKHGASMWRFDKEKLDLSNKVVINYLNTYVDIKKYYGLLYSEEFNNVIFYIFNNSIKDAAEKGNLDLIKTLVSEYPELFLLREKKTPGTAIDENSAEKTFKRIRRIHHTLVMFFATYLLSIVGLIIWSIIK